MRLIHTGFGGWGLDWARIVRDTPEVVVVAVSDPNPAALAAAAARYSLPEHARFATLEHALNETEADAVLITAAAGAHAPLALCALAAGKDVLVEKPFALTLADAQAVVGAAAARSRVLMVSQNYRFFPAPWAVRDLVAEGAIGELGSAYTDFRVNMARRLPAGHPYFALPHTGRRGVIAAFAKAVTLRREPPCHEPLSGRDNLGTLALTLGAVTSAATGRAVSL